MLPLIFIGISLILSIIFQLIYCLYQKQIYYQVFSIFCLSSSLILATEQAKFWLDYTYDWHIFRLSLIYSFTFLASTLLPLFYLLYRSLKPGRFSHFKIHNYSLSIIKNVLKFLITLYINKRDVTAGIRTNMDVHVYFWRTTYSYTPKLLFYKVCLKDVVLFLTASQNLYIKIV